MIDSNDSFGQVMETMLAHGVLDGRMNLQDLAAVKKPI
jgi:hypothetical protein